jgi:hypothetical protein
VRLRTGHELFREEQPDPWWRDAVPALDRVPPSALPAGFRDGYLLRVPVLDMSVHLPWLVARLAAVDVTVRVQALTDLASASPDADVVVDCAGLGAAALASDADLTPVRGQVVVVEQVGVEQWLLAQDDAAALTYVVPRERTVVLGGTADVGATSTSRTRRPHATSWSGARCWCRRCDGRGCWSTRSGCARCVRRCASRPGCCRTDARGARLRARRGGGDAVLRVRGRRGAARRRRA